MRRSKIITYVATALLVVALISTLFLENKIANQMTTIITVITALIGAIALFFQFKRDKDINQASFIVEYEKYFHETTGNDVVMSKLEKYRKGNTNAFTEEDYDGIVNYLVWCEGLSVLVQKGVLDFHTIDNLLSYKFFLITNCKYIQDLELIKEAEFYKGVYCLHKEWTKFKRKTHQSILCEETSLEKVENYQKYAHKGSIFNSDY